MRHFNSAAIIKRIDAYTLETADGVIIVIQAVLNKARSCMNGFSPEVCSHFLIGFPFNWEYYANRHFQSMPTIVTLSDSSEQLELPTKKVDASYPANLDRFLVDRIFCWSSSGGEASTERFKNDIVRFFISSSIHPILQSSGSLRGFNNVKICESITTFAPFAKPIVESLRAVELSYNDAVCNSSSRQQEVQSEGPEELQHRNPVATIAQMESRIRSCTVNNSDCDYDIQDPMEVELTIQSTIPVIEGNTVAASSLHERLDVSFQKDNLKITDAAKRHLDNQHADGEKMAGENDLYLAKNVSPGQISQCLVSSAGTRTLSGRLLGSHLTTSKTWSSDDKFPNVVEDSTEEPLSAEEVIAVNLSGENVNRSEVTNNNLGESMVQSISQNDKSFAINHGECSRNCKTAQLLTVFECGSRTSKSSKKQADSLICDSGLEMTCPSTSLAPAEEMQDDVCNRDNLVGPNQLKDGDANQPGSIEGQTLTADRKRTSRKKISKGVSYLHQSPLTRGKAKSFAIASPDSMNLKRTRAGRLIVPALDIACQQIVYDMEGSVVGIMNSPTQGSESEKTRKKRLTRRT